MLSFYFYNKSVAESSLPTVTSSLTSKCTSIRRTQINLVSRVFNLRGADFLAGFDVTQNFPRGKKNIKTKGCKG